MSDTPKYQKLVCLVGENPLPIYLGVKQMAAANATVILLHSKDTEGVAKNLESSLDGYTVQLRCISDPYDAESVRDVMQAAHNTCYFDENTALNYTGGTKVMSAFALLSWFQMATNPDQAFYLEEGGGVFRLGTGVVLPVNVPLSIKTLCALHGVNMSYADPAPHGYNFDDLRVLFKKTAEDELNNLRGLKFKGKNWSALRDGPQLRLLETQHDGEGWKNGEGWARWLDMLTPNPRAAWFATPLPHSNAEYAGHFSRHSPVHPSELSKQFKFLPGNGWMEVLIRDLLKQEPGVSGVELSRYFKVEGQRFESDVMTVFKHRLRYFSATTSRDEKTCKAKFFEASYRARQIGGGMAGACLVCLGDDETVQNCRTSLGIGPDIRYDIFGEDDVLDWLNGETGSLRGFLER